MAVDKKFIGREYGPLTYEIGKEKIKEYAAAIRNEDPHYMDDEFAKNSKYGGIIAPPTFAVIYSGMLAAPFFMDSELNLDFAMLVHGEQEFEFYEVVRPHDVITTTGKIANIENKEKVDVVSLETYSKNQDGKDVCKAIFTFVIRKR
ncbi:MAG: MaoC family dehydratase N-terminal domain-containing protein [Deltaproteobacteria bacterium]|nr:MaoC family dehydratase N-terminal domain-containing protein [Deltaproteobacteria bacterium]